MDEIATRPRYQHILHDSMEDIQNVKQTVCQDALICRVCARTCILESMLIVPCRA